MTGPGPYPQPAEAPQAMVERRNATDAQFVLFARQILAWHAPVPLADGREPNWCTCGTALVLCVYRTAATRFLGPAVLVPAGEAPAPRRGR